MNLKVRPTRDRQIHAVLQAIRGIPANQLAKKCYVSASTISKWRKNPQNGGTRYPQHHTLATVAAVAGLRFELVPMEKSIRPASRSRANGASSEIERGLSA